MDEGKNLSIATTEEIKRLLREVLQEQNEIPAYMTAKQAGRSIGASESYILKAKADGLLQCYQPTKGGIVRFTKQHLEDFMRRRDNGNDD